MKICLYHTLNPEAIPGYKKFAQAIEADNFVQADVRKIDTNLYRARLSIRDRLLFSLYRYQGKQSALYWNIFAIMPITLHVFFAKTWSLMRTAYNNNLCRILLIR